MCGFSPWQALAWDAVLDCDGGAAADKDDDGLPDAWEAALFGSITAVTASVDSDGDGFSNSDEWVAGTDPGEPDSAFLLDAALENGRVLILLPTVPAAGPGYMERRRLYSLQQAPLSPAAPWRDVAGYTAMLGQGQTVVYTVPVTDPVQRYRARVWLEE